MSKIKKELGVIVAFDMDNRIDAVELACKLDDAEGNFVIKIGRPLEMHYGMNVITQIRNVTDMPIIYDGKIADIPYISAKIAEAAYGYGADAVIMHSFVGNDSIEAVIDLDMGDVITVVEMSHPGWPKNLFPYTTIINMSALGVNGIVLPATNTKLIRGVNNILDDNILNSNIYIISPGIGVQGAGIGDAFSAGATYEIIGRKICDDRNPVDFAEYCYGWAKYWANVSGMAEKLHIEP